MPGNPSSEIAESVIGREFARKQAFASLAERDEILAKALAFTGEPEWREWPGGFAGICRLIAAQQISTGAAQALWRRVEADPALVTAEGIAAADPEALRACGWSRPKIAHLKSVAAAEISGALDFARISAMKNDDALATLCTIRGIGPWTARLYLMFCDQRDDLIPDNDLALLESFRILTGAQTRMRPAEFAPRAERWRPFRTAAALILWNYVTAHRNAEKSGRDTR